MGEAGGKEGGGCHRRTCSERGEGGRRKPLHVMTVPAGVAAC